MSGSVPTANVNAIVSVPAVDKLPGARHILDAVQGSRAAPRPSRQPAALAPG
jgi:hypothetical protein